MSVQFLDRKAADTLAGGAVAVGAPSAAPSGGSDGAAVELPLQVLEK